MAGPSIFGIDIQEVIADVITPDQSMKFVLRHLTAGDYDPMSPSSGRVTTTQDYPCNGFIVSYSQEEMLEDKNIEENDSKAVVVAKPLYDLGIEPSKDDVFVDDRGHTYTIVRVKTNGARATYVLQIRG